VVLTHISYTDYSNSNWFGRISLGVSLSLKRDPCHEKPCSSKNTTVKNTPVKNTAVKNITVLDWVLLPTVDLLKILG
jgi:hypothetical protein